MEKKSGKIYEPYWVFICMYGAFLITAFCMNTPAELYEGYKAILTSRSILITDYIAIGNIGATLLNVVIIGGLSICMLIKAGVKPNGSTIMALCLTTGFSFFGKNIINMIPITFGVWLYAKYQREPFRNFSLVAMLSATVSPIVSEILFYGMEVWDYEVTAVCTAALIGILAGFVFPSIASFCVRVHDGYNLYNLGFAGGLISSFVAALLQGLGLEAESVLYWSTGNNIVLAILMYGISIGLILTGFYLGEEDITLSNLLELMKHPGRAATDFYMMFGPLSFVNMGLMGILGTSTVLLLGADLNGPTISGILTMIGFGCFGKHLKNSLPLLGGAILGSVLNAWDVTWPANILAILFSTGLAPIAGKFGWGWGILAGFLHVNFIIHIRFINSGMNLYNNGYAAGFVALLLVPILTALRRDRSDKR